MWTCVAAARAPRRTTRHIAWDRRGLGQLSDRWFYVCVVDIDSCRQSIWNLRWFLFVGSSHPAVRTFHTLMQRESMRSVLKGTTVSTRAMYWYKPEFTYLETPFPTYLQAQTDKSSASQRGLSNVASPLTADTGDCCLDSMPGNLHLVQ
jgi:hypothetical protein